MWGQKNFCCFPKLLELEYCVLRANFADQDFREEFSMPTHGKVSKCVGIIAIYVKKIVLETFLHVAPKAFRLLVGVRKTSLASSRQQQASQNGNYPKVYGSTYLSSPRSML